MRKNIVAFLSVILVAGLLTGGKAIVNITSDSGTLYDRPTHSITQSKDKGIFQSVVSASPAVTVFNGENISFKEIWIERQVKTLHPLVWFTSQDLQDRFIILFTLKEGMDMFHFQSGNFQGPFFKMDAIPDSYFGTIGSNELFFLEIPPSLFARGTGVVSLVKNLTAGNGQPIALTWQVPN